MSENSESGRVTLLALASSIAQEGAARNPTYWEDGDDPEMRRTIVEAMNLHGWEADGVPGALKEILRMIESREISAYSAFNDFPVFDIEDVKKNPSNWYLREKDVEAVRRRFGVDDASGTEARVEGASTTIPRKKRWSLKTPYPRDQGYGPALIALLEAAHKNGLELPTATQVVAEWRSNKPEGVEDVGKVDITYLNAKGQRKVADLEAIGKAIARRVEQ